MAYLKNTYKVLSDVKSLPKTPSKSASTFTQRQFYCQLAKDDKDYCSYLKNGTPIIKSFDCTKKIQNSTCGNRKNKAIPFTLNELENTYKKLFLLPQSYKKLTGLEKRRFMCRAMYEQRAFCKLLSQNVKNSSSTKSPPLLLKDDPSKIVIRKVQPTLDLIPIKQPINIKHGEFFTRYGDIVPWQDESFDKFVKRINKEFRQYKWKKPIIENMCNMPQSSDRIVKFTPSQDFISHYFVPQNSAKGLLVWHSVGTGKTCTAVATKSKTWEQMEYTILWVTRTTLRSDIWKNMFDKVCDELIRRKIENGVNVPTGTEAKKFMSKQFLQPISFAQFSNAAKQSLGQLELIGKHNVYNKLVSINGKEDPFKRTLIIIDEAHKLLAKDIVGNERPDFEAIRTVIANSYKISKNNSCRPLLMTATPIMDDPMDFIRLLNLLDVEQMPTNINDFMNAFPLENMVFKSKSIKAFQKLMKGKISYLNRSYDPRQFTQPVFHDVNVEISGSDEKEIESKEIEECNKQMDEMMQSVQEQDEKIIQELELLVQQRNQIAGEKEIAEHQYALLKQDKAIALEKAPPGTKRFVAKTFVEEASEWKKTVSDYKKQVTEANKQITRKNAERKKLTRKVKKEAEKQQAACVKKIKKTLKNKYQHSQRNMLIKKCNLPSKLFD